MPGSIVNILLLHTKYREPGGEDRVFDHERALLLEQGEQVSVVLESNRDDVNTRRPVWLKHSLWSRPVATRIGEIIRRDRPDVAHIHNTFFRLSPVVYHTLGTAGIPIVQTLHNYRWICPAGTLYRDGGGCEECIGKKVPFPAVVHACYRNSLVASAGLVAIVGAHNILNTLLTHVDLFISPSHFLRARYIEAGFPADRIVVKPHAVPNPGGMRGQCEGPALFVGRLSEEKGVRILFSAWRQMHDIPLLVAGDGPLRGFAGKMIRDYGMRNVRLLGQQTPAEMVSLIKSCSMLVAPSAVPESFGLAIIEAFSAGVPVICAGHGAAVELVKDGHSGLHCHPRDPADLAAKVRLLFRDQAERLRLGKNGYQQFLEHYSLESNYRKLTAVYATARNNRNEREDRTPA